MNKLFKKIKGTALVYVLAVLAAATVLFAGTIQFVVSHVKYNTTLEPRTQALHVAEAGIYFYRWYLAHNVEGKTATQIEAFWNNNPLGVDDNGDGDCDDPDTVDGDGDGTEAYVVDYKDDNDNIVGQYKICVTPPELYSTVLYVKSTGSASSSGINQERTISARLRKPSWSEFAILGNNMIRLSAGTEVFGPMHVNGGFHFDGTAHNIVTSSIETYYDSDSDVSGTRPGVWAAAVPGSDNSVDSDDSEHFLAGKQYPVVSQDFNSVTANFDEMRSEAVSNNLYFNNSYRGRYIVLDAATKKMDIYKVQSYNWNYTPTLKRTCTGWGWWGSCTTDPPEVKDIPSTGVIYVEDNVWIQGTVPSNTKLTIAANDPRGSVTPKIFIGDEDIYYEDYTSDTVLGLAAEGDISVIRYDDSLDDNVLHIDAVLLSQKGRIGRDHFSSWNDTRDTIELYGAIATNTRMGFGYTDGTGFQTRKLIFDNNLLYSPPPLFPTGNTYAIDLWDEIK